MTNPMICVSIIPQKADTTRRDVKTVHLETRERRMIADALYKVVPHSQEDAKRRDDLICLFHGFV